MQLFSQRQKPSLHFKVQAVPSQVVTPSGEVGHIVHDGPQAVRLVGSTHSPLHRFLSGGQALSQGAFGRMQLLRQGRRSEGQEIPQRVPSQVAVPSWIAGQASSQAIPQLVSEVLLAHLSLQR
jgi:hypothetical protein